VSPSRIRHIEKPVCFVVIVLIGLANHSLAEEAAQQVAPLPLNSRVISRIAFGSCAKHWQYQPIWETIIVEKPDLFLFLGDAIYADNDGATAWDVTEKQLQGEWNRLADKPEYQRFRAEVPIMATWDNHDYGTHNGGAEFELKEASKMMFLGFFGEPAESERRRRSGIYDAKVFGPEGRRTQIILLDTRTFRGPFKRDERTKDERLKVGKVGGYLPNDDAEVTVLGDAQWAWLERQLRQPAEIRLLCSSTQIIPDAKGMDEWGCFPHERQRLFDVISATKANGTILLTGNVHFAEVSRVKTKSYPLIDFTSSGLTHINEVYASADNEYRIAGPFVELNFGLVEIDWSAKPSTLITLNAVAIDGSTAFSHRISLNQLQGTAK
jgi:alkaline phosphatase D